MLQAVVSKEALADTLVMIVVDLSRPWTIPDSLARWSSVLSDHIDSLDAGELLDELRKQAVHNFQTYSEEEPESSKEGEDTKVVLDLDEGTLTTNLGVPIIVVGTKDDSAEQLQEERDYRQEHFDFIQLHIREFCLKHGAGLIYTGRAQKTAPTFYRYIMHVAYGFPCSDKACIAESSGLFVPSGWDNPTKISVLEQSFTTVSRDKNYNEVVQSLEVPTSAGSARTVVADNEQEFLARQREQVIKSDPNASSGSTPGGGGGRSLTAPRRASPNPATTPTQRSGSGPRPARQRDPLRLAEATEIGGGSGGRQPRPRTESAGRRAAGDRGSRSPPAPGGGGTPTGPPGAGANGQNTDVLAKFFNSLLGSQPGAAGTPPAGSTTASRGTGRADSTQELGKYAAGKGED
jgi:dynein light intermediate chain 1